MKLPFDVCLAFMATDLAAQHLLKASAYFWLAVRMDEISF
jgi:hypothetical protein